MSVDLLIRHLPTDAPYPVESLYCERFWLPTIGPSCLWASRLFVRLLDENGNRPLYVDLATIARMLGLGAGTGANAPIMRTLRRLVDFGFAANRPDGGLDVPDRVRDLAPRHVARLPRELRDQLIEMHRRARA